MPQPTLLSLAKRPPQTDNTNDNNVAPTSLQQQQQQQQDNSIQPLTETSVSSLVTHYSHCLKKISLQCGLHSSFVLFFC